MEKENKLKFGKRQYLDSITKNTFVFSYALYFCTIILGVYNKVSITSPTLNLGDYGSIRTTLFILMGCIASRLLLYIGLYGLLLTYLRKKWMSFYTYFTILSSIILLTSLFNFINH